MYINDLWYSFYSEATTVTSSGSHVPCLKHTTELREEEGVYQLALSQPLPPNPPVSMFDLFHALQVSLSVQIHVLWVFSWGSWITWIIYCYCRLSSYWQNTSEYHVHTFSQFFRPKELFFLGSNIFTNISSHIFTAFFSTSPIKFASKSLFL